METTEIDGTDPNPTQGTGLTGLTGPPVAGTEAETLVGCLERQRRTLAWKCGGLDAAGMTATLGPSAVTLGGLLKHLARVEDHYFSRCLHGNPPLAPFDDDDDWDRDWVSAASDSPEQLVALWEQMAERSRRLLAEAVDEGGLDQGVQLGWSDGRRPSLRRVLGDLIEEYARHVGHADLIRESVDGVTGEDPPA